MEKIVFDNKLTVALDYKSDVHSAAVGIYIAAGNRFEPIEKAGIAHFIEHMVFKGTTTRTSQDIARESDIMGGQLNAYTAKEYTCFFSRALTEHVAKTLHLLCDMLCNPLFDEKDMETEKGVVLEEIGMYEDSPEDYCSDMLNALCYKDKPLGLNILGTRETVSQMTTDDLREYMSKIYVPERTVVSLCGNFDRNEVLDILASYFGNRKNTGNLVTIESERINSGITLCRRPAEQTHIALCFNGLSSSHPLRHAASFFSSIAGGASSSRINRRIREELGLAYSVYTFSVGYLGTGIFGLAGGLAHKNQEQFLRESLQILLNARDHITAEDVELTRQQFKAGIVLSNESLSSMAASAGRQLLLDGTYKDMDEILREIDSVTKEQVLETAQLITDTSNYALSVVGNAKDESFYKQILENFK